MLRRCAAAALVLVTAACSSATTGSDVNLSPEALPDMGVDLFGVVVDIPHRKSLGTSSATGTNPPQQYAWQAEHSLLERGESVVWISAEVLQIAGLPALDQGVTLDYTGGVYRDTRFRLAGTIDHIGISALYDVRIRTQWRLYDTESGEFVFEGASNGFARGSTLGTTGIQPNAMLDSFESCVRDLLNQADFQAVIQMAPEAAGAAG